MCCAAGNGVDGDEEYGGGDGGGDGEVEREIIGRKQLEISAAQVSLRNVVSEIK